MGKVLDHDQVLIVRRLEPTRVGSLVYYVTDQETHVFEEDVRHIVALGLVETRRIVNFKETLHIIVTNPHDTFT